MADILKETREALLRTAERAGSFMLSRHGFGPQEAATGPGMTLGANGVAGFETVFATGYDGAETTMAFMLDLSLVDGPDLLGP